MRNRMLNRSAHVSRAIISGSMLFLLLQFGSINFSRAAETMAPGPYKAPLIYAMRLPQYCDGLYFRGKPSGKKPTKNLTSRELCGVGTNHFCPGLVALYQARDARDRNQKINFYNVAKKEMEYTKSWISDYPQCPLHPLVNRTLMEINATLKIYK